MKTCIFRVPYPKTNLDQTRVLPPQQEMHAGADYLPAGKVTQSVMNQIMGARIIALGSAIIPNRRHMSLFQELAQRRRFIIIKIRKNCKCQLQ